MPSPSRCLSSPLPPLPLLSAHVLPASSLAPHALRVYDPGLAHTLFCKSAISLILPSSSTLLHRGYPLEQLSHKCSYLELVHLLFFSRLPTRLQLSRFAHELDTHATLPAFLRPLIVSFPRTAHPMTIMQAAVAALSAAYPSLNPAIAGHRVYARSSQREKAMYVALAAMPAVMAAVYRHREGRAPVFLDGVGFEHGAADRFLSLAGLGRELWRRRALERLWLVHAEHELNCSTAVVRALCSAGTDLFAAIAGGVAALYGALHGGAAEETVKMLRSVDECGVERFVEKVKRGEQKLMGFGHRVYRSYDPRARVLKKEASDMREKGRAGELMQVAERLEKVALADQYFIQRRLFPNCDFYSGIVYQGIGVGETYLGAMFAVARCAGWLAHWAEYQQDPERRIMRPHQVYVGDTDVKQVVSIDQRQQHTTTTTAKL